MKRLIFIALMFPFSLMGQITIDTVSLPDNFNADFGKQQTKVEGFGNRGVRSFPRANFGEIRLKIVLNVCINQNGHVVGVSLNSKESTISDKYLVSTCIGTTKLVQFSKSNESTKCGLITYYFDNLR